MVNSERGKSGQRDAIINAFLSKTQKTEVVKTPALLMQSPKASRSVNASIAKIFGKINPFDEKKFESIS